MFIRTPENYREVLKSIVELKPDLRIFLLTLFNILVGTYLERETCSVKAEIQTLVRDSQSYHKLFQKF